MKTYLIPQGEHRSVWFPRFHVKGDHFKMKAQFNSSCRYRIPDSDQNDINKLGGLGYGFNHHQNSFRIGWRWNVKSKRVEIFSYCYIDGDVEYDLIYNCGDTATLSFDIRRVWFVERYKWVIHIEENGITSMRYVNAPQRLPDYGFKLYPYFGGDHTAPHDIEIRMEI